MDRLADLQGTASNNPFLTNEEADNGINWGEADEGKETSMDEHMAQYELIASCLSKIEAAREQVVMLKARSHDSVNEIVLNQCTKDLGDVMAQTQQYAGQIKKRLAAIKTSNDQESKEGAQADIREGLYQQHIRRFHKTMNEYNSAVYAYKKNMQDRQRRQLNIVTDNKYSEEELDEIIDAGQAGQVISDVLFTDTMEDTLQDIRDRNEAIQNLEQSVMEIYELFQDLSNLVDLQSESLDVIEHKVGKSKQYLKDGHKNVVKSQDYVKKSRKTKCFLLLLLLAILIAVLVAVLVPALSKA